MYFTRLSRSHLPNVAELEERSYPEELIHGLQSITDEYEKNLMSYSVGGFSNGELVGYVLAYKMNFSSRHIYISDLNCPNPKYLKRLLLRFFILNRETNEDIIYSAHLRENSYYLLCNQQRKRTGVIQIIDDDYMPEFYDNREAAHHVTFQINTEAFLQNNWKDSLHAYLDNVFFNEETNILKSVFRYLENWVEQVDFYDRRNMEFIIQCMTETIIDYYKMFADIIPGKSIYHLYTRKKNDKTGTGFKKVISKLQSNGYEEGREENGYIYYSYYGMLQISKTITVFNTQFKDTLSGYRWLRNKQQRYESEFKNGKLAWTSYFNKYGERHYMIKVPYLTEKMYLYNLNKVCFKKQLIRKMDVSNFDDYSFGVIVERIYFLLRSKDAQKCIINIVEKKNQDNRNYFHDWAIIVDGLILTHTILTEGAIKKILCGSYNQALSIYRNIMEIKQIIIDDKKMSKLFDIGIIRKKISKQIRKNENSSMFLKELVEYVNDYYCDRLNFSVSVKEKIPEYMKRLQSYKENISINTLYRLFGKDCLSKFIRGTYPGVFTPQTINPPYNVLTDFLMGFLQKRTTQAKHVYWRLKREGLLEAIKTGNITSVQYHTILNILLNHNVKTEGSMVKNLCDFRICIEQKGSPEYLIAGDASVCCMSLGTQKAIVYAKEKGFGIVNVYYRNRIIANSVIWINKPYQCLVLDNIEVHPNYLKFREHLKLCFCTAAEHLMTKYNLCYVAQGAQYNDLELYNDNYNAMHFKKIEPLGVQTEHFYSDALYYKKVMTNVQRKDSSETFDGIRDAVAA